MPRITPADAQGWAESTKLNVSNLDAFLVDAIETEILARLSTVYDTTVWTDNTNTPSLVKVIISKTYVSWIYDRAYSENQVEGNDYAVLLRANAEMLIIGLIQGIIDIPGVSPIGSGVPGYYPNDASSAQLPTSEDPSLGPSYFSMGKVF